MARVGKHKLGVSAGKYKLGTRDGNNIWGLGPGLGTKQRARSQDIQIHVKDLLNTGKNSSKGSTSNPI